MRFGPHSDAGLWNEGSKLGLLAGVLFFAGEAILSPGSFAQKSNHNILEFRPAPVNLLAPPQARLRTIKSDPNNSLKLYTATIRGLQVSTDAGRSWSSLSVAGGDDEVFALETHPSRPDVVFVGRRDGLWLTQDGGRSWDALPHPGSVPLTIAAARSQPDVLYLASSRQGVHKSMDGGHHWITINAGLPQARAGGRAEEVHKLIVEPNDSNTAYASVERLGVFRTVNGGAKWHEFNQGLPFPLARPVSAAKLAYDPNDPKNLYLVMNHPIHSHLVRPRLFVLSDDGRWRFIQARIPDNFAVHSLAVDAARKTLQLWGDETVLEAPLPVTATR